MSDHSVSSEDIIRLLSCLIQDDLITRDATDVDMVIVLTGQIHIHIRILLELGYDLAGRIDDQVHIVACGYHIAQDQDGIVDGIGGTAGVLALDQHVGDLAPDVSVALHGDESIALSLGEETVIGFDLRKLSDHNGESVQLIDRSGGIVGSTDLPCPSDSELICPQLSAGGRIECAAVQPDINDAFGNILLDLVIDAGYYRGSQGDITVLLGDDGQSGDLVIVDHRDIVDIEAGSGLLAVDYDDLVQGHVHTGAVTDDHIGQETVVIDGESILICLHRAIARSGRKDQIAQCLEQLIEISVSSGDRSRCLTDVGIDAQGTAVIVIQPTESDLAVNNGTNISRGLEPVIVQTGIVDISVLVDIHETAGRTAANVEGTVQDHIADDLQRGTGDSILTSVIRQTEGEDLYDPLGSGIGAGLCGTFNDAAAVDIGRARDDGDRLTGEVCILRYIDLADHSIAAVRGIDTDIGPCDGRAGGTFDGSAGRSGIVHLGSLGLDRQGIDTAQEHIVQIDDLLIVHGVDIGEGLCLGARRTGNRVRGGSELLDDVGIDDSDLTVDVSLCIGSGHIRTQRDIGGDLDSHIRLAAVATRKALQVTVRVSDGLGGIGGLDCQRTEESSNSRRLTDSDLGGAGLLHICLRALARKDETAARHIQVRIHVGFRGVAAQDAQIAVAGYQSGVIAHRNELLTVPGQVDPGRAVLTEADILRIDDAVQIHIGIGLQGHIALCLRIGARTNGYGALLVDGHADLGLTAGDSTDGRVVDLGIALDLVLGLDLQVPACKDLTVQIGLRGLVIHIVEELISADADKRDRSILVGLGEHLRIGLGIDIHITDGLDIHTGADAGLSGIASDRGMGLNILAVYAGECVGRHLRLGNHLSTGSKGLDADTVRTDDCTVPDSCGSGHTLDLCVGMDHIQRSQAGSSIIGFGLCGHRGTVSLCQHRNDAGHIDGHIAADMGIVLHLGIGIRPVCSTCDKAHIRAAIAAQFGRSTAVIHPGYHRHITGRGDRPLAFDVCALGHIQIGLCQVDTDTDTADGYFLAVHIRVGEAVASVDQDIDITGDDDTAAPDTAGCGSSGGSHGSVDLTADSFRGEAACGLTGLCNGLRTEIHIDIDAVNIDLCIGAVKVRVIAACCFRIHDHDTQVGTVGLEGTAGVMGLGIADSTGEDTELTAGIVLAAEVSTGNECIVYRGDCRVSGIRIDVGTTDTNISGLQLRLSTLRTVIIEPCDDFGLMGRVHRASGDGCGLLRGNGSVHIADQEVAAADCDSRSLDGREGGRRGIRIDPNALVGAGKLSGSDDITVGDRCLIDHAGIGIGHVYRTGRKGKAGLGLLSNSLRGSRHIAADIDRIRLDDRAITDSRREQAVSIGIHMDRAHIDKTDRSTCSLGMRLGIALRVILDGHGGRFDMSIGCGSLTEDTVTAAHLCRDHIDGTAVNGCGDGTGSRTAQNSLGALVRPVIELAVHGNRGSFDTGIIQLCLLLSVHGGRQHIDHCTCQRNIALSRHFRLRHGGTISEDGDIGSLDG